MTAGANTARVCRTTARLRNAVPFAVATAGVAAFSFLSGGYILGRSTPVAVTWLGLAAVWVWFLRRRSRPSILCLAGLAAFGLFALWTGISVLWSFGPDLTWVSFNLTALYLAVVAVLALTSARGLELRTAAYGSLVVITAVGVYAFLGKAAPDLVTHAHTYARLDSPVGYWNVLALMMVIGLCLALAIAGDRRAPLAARIAAVAVSVPMCLTFFFTFSRGGWLALLVALVLYFAFTTTRLPSLWSLAVIVAPVTLVLWRLWGLETLFTETTDDALRALEGGALLRWSIAAIVATSGLQAIIVLAESSIRWPRRSSVVAGAVVLALIGTVAVGGSVGFVETKGGVSWVKDRVSALLTDSDTQGASNAADRLASMSTGRPELWREAVDQSRYARVKGTGAGTFPFTHYRFRSTGGGVVKHAHSQWYNVLSELGVVGLVLFVAAMVLLVAAAVGNPFKRRDDPLHPLLIAMEAGVIAFFVHISWDWDWDMAAIGTLVFVFIAACASYHMTRAAGERRARAEAAAMAPELEAETIRPAAGDDEREAEAGLRATDEAEAAGDRPADAEEQAGSRPAAAPPSRGLRWAPRVVASAALVLLAVSWLPPYLAGRAENDALTAASEGDVTTALAHARTAARLDPLAVSPLLTEATLLQQQGRNREALAQLRRATELQPQNYEVWYQLGLLEHGALGREKAAKASFRRSLALNPGDSASRYELEMMAQ